MRLQRLTTVVKSYDRKLYVDLIQGKPCVCRETVNPEVFDVDGTTVVNFNKSPYLVFPLTDNWNMTGTPVEWGIEPILARLKAMDLWNRDIAKDLIESYEKKSEEKDRDRRNNTESFLYEFRSQFAHATKDINTSTLKKTDLRKTNEKRIK